MSRQPTFRPDRLGLGIDGGGSKTLAWLVSADPDAPPRLLGRGHAGPSNPRIVGVEAAGQHLLQAIEAAFAEAGIDRRSVATAGVALAGVGNESLRQTMEKWCHEHNLAKHVCVVHDALAVLYAGSHDGTGIALIAGTGSFSFGRVASGNIARAGGWGYVFGDEGSGYWLGVAALRAVTHADDGRGPRTAMTAPILDRLNANNIPDLVPQLCLASPPRRLIASLAPIVVACAGREDPVAQQLVLEAADQLAQQVTAVARVLGIHTRPIHLCLAGGLLAGSLMLAQQTVDKLRRDGFTLEKVRVIERPAAGAARIARQLLRNPPWNPYSNS